MHFPQENLFMTQIISLAILWTALNYSVYMLETKTVTGFILIIYGFLRWKKCNMHGFDSWQMLDEPGK